MCILSHGQSSITTATPSTQEHRHSSQPEARHRREVMPKGTPASSRSPRLTRRSIVLWHCVAKTIPDIAVKHSFHNATMELRSQHGFRLLTFWPLGSSEAAVWLCISEGVCAYLYWAYIYIYMHTGICILNTHTCMYAYYVHMHGALCVCVSLSLYVLCICMYTFILP